MTLTVEIPEELARRLGPEAARLSREALGLEAHRQGLWTEAELGRFLGLSRVALDRSAIALATTLQPFVLLIDERAGSAIARSLGLRVTGTLGVLDEAARRRLISLPDRWIG